LLGEIALSRTPNVIVFDMFKAHNLKRVVMGEEVGTLVTG
jgi:uridylate kinase